MYDAAILLVGLFICVVMLMYRLHVVVRQNELMKEQYDEAIEVLHYYADPSHYNEYESGSIKFNQPEICVIVDHGTLAREFLMNRKHLDEVC